MNQPFLLPDDHYPFKKPEGLLREYSFATVYEVGYRIIFKPSPYLFGEEKPYANLLYEFSIVAKFAGPQSYRRDDRIAPTVIAIFLDFYNQHDKNICFYICDSSDGKHHLRARRFTMWYHEYNQGGFFKADGALKDTNGDFLPVSIIMTTDNEYKNQIIEDFTSLLRHYNDPK